MKLTLLTVKKANRNKSKTKERRTFVGEGNNVRDAAFGGS